MLFFANLPLQCKHILAPAIIATLAILAFIFEQNFITTLIYQRDLIGNGEYFRLITGHLFHTNTNHLLMNLAGLLLLWSLHGHYYQVKTFFLFFIFSALITSVGIYFSSPTMLTYVGLSGVLHGLFVWGTCQDIKCGLKSGYVLLIGITVKIAHEQIYGASDNIIQLINANVAIDAHLWGAISGICWMLLMFIYYYMITKQSVTTNKH
jgi:rhomboid family GlyGly-CTERM serine protease